VDDHPIAEGGPRYLVTKRLAHPALPWNSTIDLMHDLPAVNSRLHEEASHPDLL
jgi:hypothetical protein